MVALTLPTITVQIAFANNPLTPLASLTWTDVSQYVESLSTKRGRQHELARFEAGTLQMRLVNFDGRFNPFNTSSPYYGPFTDGTDTGVLGLVPMKRVRVRATWPVSGGTTYDLWNGYIDQWSLAWPAEKEAYADVSATDALKLFNLKNVLGKYAQTVLADGPSAYWRLGDPIGTIHPVDSSGNGHTGTCYPSVASAYPTFGVSGPLICDPGTACDFGQLYDNFTGGGGPFIDVTGGGPTSSASRFSLELWVRSSATPSSTTLNLAAQFPLTYANRWQLVLDFTGHPILSFYDNAGGSGTTVAGSSPSLTNGNWHHLVVTNSTTALLIYVDGVMTSNNPGLSMALSAAAPTYLGTDGGTTSGGFALDEVAFYSDITLSAAQVANHYALRHGFLQERSDQRIADMLDVIGWPTADRSLETGLSAVTAPANDLSTVLAHLYDVADTENGPVFIAANGQVVFHNRQHTFTAATSKTSQVTLGEGAEPYDLVGTAVGVDDLDVYNEIVVTRAGGIAQTATDPRSRARYGPRSYSRSGVLNLTDQESYYAASYHLNRESQPLVRVKAITVHPLSDPATLFPQVLARELGEQVTVTRTAPGTAYSQASDLEGIEHTVDPAGDWHTVWRLSPHDATPYFVLNDAVLGTLSTTNALFY